MKIWAHRGCSQRYPENTLTAFSKAVELKELAGIELDIQMTKDGEIVVIHDERVDRTTNGIGYIKDFTYRQLRKLEIDTGNGKLEKIPSFKETLDILEKRMRQGLLLNIELKNSVVPYVGMEDEILGLVAKKGLQEWVIYSSFYTKSMVDLRKLEPEASVGILDVKVSDCFYKKRGGFEGKLPLTALHPHWRGIDLTKEQLKGETVRAWFTGHLYPERPTGTKLDLSILEQQGITDVFLNEPEVYLS